MDTEMMFSTNNSDEFLLNPMKVLELKIFDFANCQNNKTFAHMAKILSGNR